MVMSPIHKVWPKPSSQARWKGEEDKADRGRGGKTTSGNGQAWSLPRPRGQWRTGKKWRKLVVKSSVVPKWPSWLRARWWWWCWLWSWLSGIQDFEETACHWYVLWWAMSSSSPKYLAVTIWLVLHNNPYYHVTYVKIAYKNPSGIKWNWYV